MIELPPNYFKTGRKKIAVSSHKKFIKIQEVSADYENLYVLREAKNLENNFTFKKISN